MKLLIDTNILLDVLQNREPYTDLSLTLWNLCVDERVTGYISTMSLANISYIMQKELTPERMQEIYITLALGFNFADLKMSDLSEAADMKWPDFEDAVQSAIASRINADYIITRNVKDFQGSRTPAISPEYYFTNIFIV